MPEARRIVFRMLECDKPVMARVNGHAVGLGVTIALLCDIIIIAADHAKIGDPYAIPAMVSNGGGSIVNMCRLPASSAVSTFTWPTTPQRP